MGAHTADRAPRIGGLPVLFVQLHSHRILQVLSDPVEIHHDRLADKRALLFLLGASFATFAITRLYTRLARRHDWQVGNKIGDVHVHHMVFGLVLVLVSGMVDISLALDGSARDVVAVTFGVGAAFILDEFALSFHLRDVYWGEEGRRSIDACIMWLLLGLILLVGISPFGIHDKAVIPRTVGLLIVTASIVLSLVTCLKGKLMLGLVSVFVPPVGVVTAMRLARPGSIWALKMYPEGSAKLERSRARFCPQQSRIERHRLRIVDMLAGAPTTLPK